MDDASDRIRFEPVAAACYHVHCYLNGYYVARITLHADHCGVDGPRLAPCRVPNEEEARELARMWLRHRKH